MPTLRTKTPLLIAAGVIGSLLTVSALWSQFSPTLIINYTQSMPIGVYKIEHISEWRHGMPVAITVPEHVKSLLHERGWLSKKGLLIKPIGALPSDEVCIDNAVVKVNGSTRGAVFSKDSNGLPIPMIRGCFHIKAGQLFLLSTHIARSFDGRYFGPIPMDQVLGEAVPLWLF